MNARTGSLPWDLSGRAKTPEEYKTWCKEKRAREQANEPFYYSDEHDQGMGVPSICRCGQSLSLRPIGWVCLSCGTGYGRSE